MSLIKKGSKNQSKEKEKKGWWAGIEGGTKITEPFGKGTILHLGGGFTAVRTGGGLGPTYRGEK